MDGFGAAARWLNPVQEQSKEAEPLSSSLWLLVGAFVDGGCLPFAQCLSILLSVVVAVVVVVAVLFPRSLVDKKAQ